jgi:hypothetical protein
VAETRSYQIGSGSALLNPIAKPSSPTDIRMVRPKFATEKPSPRAVRFRLPCTHYSHKMSIPYRREVRVMDGSGRVQEPAQRDRGGRDHAGRGADGQQGARPAAAEPAENSVAETAPVVPAFAELGADLHPACTFRSSEGSGEATEAVESMEAAPCPPLPEFESSCIRPAISRRASRHAGPSSPGAAATDDLHSACIGRNSGSAFRRRRGSCDDRGGRRAAFPPDVGFLHPACNFTIRGTDRPRRGRHGLPSLRAAASRV